MMANADGQEHTAGRDTLNGPQRMRLRVSCQYIDKLLADIVNILHDASSRSPFGRYIVDVNAGQIQALETHIQRIREQLVRALAWQRMEPEAPTIPATRAVLTNLSFIEIAVEELRPRYMRGSGPVSESVAGELNGVVHELRSLVEGMGRYLRQEMGVNLEERLNRLAGKGADVALLTMLSDAITKYGMVEFRGRVESLVGRLEDPAFEIALFGRVSCGKSSLLNALLGLDVLPVGINPITAVPTKLRSGPAARAAIAFAGGRSETISIEELKQYVTEEFNPGNQQNVVRAVAEVPSPVLKEGIVLVDTPGLGSLARRGTEETLAYLPSADLALVLIDAGSTLNGEDIGTLRLLYEAGIPPLLVLSKADLLNVEDIARAKSYIAAQIREEIGVDLAVHPVSAVPDRKALLDAFFEHELLPRFDHARSLREDSAARKILNLRDSVVAAMELMLDRGNRVGDVDQAVLHRLERELSRAVGEMGEQQRLFDQEALVIEEASEHVLSSVARGALDWAREQGWSEIPPLQIMDWIDASVEALMRETTQRLSEAVAHVYAALEQVAGALRAAEVPARDEMEVLLRELPRFEPMQPDHPIKPGHWGVLSNTVALRRMQAHLHAEIGGRLKAGLRAYGSAVREWGRQATRKLELVVASYADGYRMQIQRMGGHADAQTDVSRMREDLDRLRSFGDPAQRTAMRDGKARAGVTRA